MRERIEQLVGPATASKIWMGTFHSLFGRILRVNAERIGYKANYTIYDTADSKSLVKSIVRDLQLDDKIYKPNTVLSSISMAKNALISPEEYRRLPDLMEADRRAKRGETAEIYRIYRDRCVSAGAMDFDDLLYYTNVLLRDNPDVLHHYQEYFRYLLVDEYQDTNFAQHVIVTRLTESSQKLCVVGDDAQSIYSFRGANIRNILNLHNSYPTLRTYKLEQNYRSTRTIIDAANSLIEKNTEQIRKHVFTTGEKGAKIEVAKAFSDYEEAFIVANRISQVKMQSHDSYDDFAILYRTNAQSRILEESLRKRDIPYRIYGGLSFYQRKEIKDAVAYFRLAVNPDDDEALRRIINFPARGIGETTLAKLTRGAISSGRSIWSVLRNPAASGVEVNKGTLTKLNNFASLIAGFVEMNSNGVKADELARAIISRTGMMTMLLSDSTPENVSKRQNLEELLGAATQYVDEIIEQGSEETGMTDFLARISLATDQDTDTDPDGKPTPRVTLMTVHAAKGLEFGNVFIVGVEKDLFPSAMAQSSSAEIEEERRLLYVAITRAKRFCMMSYASSRFRNGQTQTCAPSPFLRDIDPQCLRPVSGADFGSTAPDPTMSYRSEAMRSGATRQLFGRRQSASDRYTAPLRTIGAQPARQSAPQTSTQHGDGDFRTFTSAELSEGMRIVHRTFGDGTIVRVDTSASDHKIVVRFDSENATKTLLLKFARLMLPK